MPYRRYHPREDDVASIQTLLPPYLPRSRETSRPPSTAPSYHTIELGRTENGNEEQVVVPAQVRGRGQSRPESSVERVLSEERTEVRFTMLLVGIWRQKTALAILSILSGAQVNAQTENGVTPIHCAELKGSTTMIKILLMKGADIDVKEEHGLTPLDLAFMRGHTKAIRLLISRGANIDHLVVRKAIRSSPSISEESYEEQTWWRKYRVKDARRGWFPASSLSYDRDRFGEDSGVKAIW